MQFLLKIFFIMCVDLLEITNETAVWVLWLLKKQSVEITRVTSWKSSRTPKIILRWPKLLGLAFFGRRQLFSVIFHFLIS